MLRESAKGYNCRLRAAFSGPLPPMMTYSIEVEVSAETKNGWLQRCCYEPLFIWQKQNPDHLERVLGASLIHHSALEIPRQQRLRDAVCSSSGSAGGSTPGGRCKTSGTHFRQPIAGHRSFPKTLGKPSSNLFRLCVGDWVSSRECWKQQHQRGWLWNEQIPGSCLPCFYCFMTPLPEMQTQTPRSHVTHASLLVCSARMW